MPGHDNHTDTSRCFATVLFADIHGFIQMSERMDPIELVSIMNDWFEMMEYIITAHQGTIDKFVGDCVMALFGCPRHIPDAPKKAIRTAIEMRRSLYNFNVEKRFTIPMDLHIGINTGVVVAGMVGGRAKREFTVMGDTVNIASRLEDMSEEGQILVGSHTYEETKDEYDYRKVGVVAMGGRSKEIAAYELLPIWSVFKAAKSTDP
jgi:adenylate cyclase